MNAFGIAAHGHEHTRPVRIIRPPTWRNLYGLDAIARLLEYRDLLLTLSAHRLSVRYKQSALGSVWALLQPLAMMLVFTAVFSRLARMPSEAAPYALFAYAGLLPWTLFATSVSSGTTSLVTNAPLVTKVSFPREILPATYVVAALADLMIASVALVGMLVFYAVPVTMHALWVVPIVALLGGFSLACGMLLGAVQVRIRDVGIALTVALQLWMFASPVLYPLSAVPHHARWWYILNPMAGFVDGFRRAVLGQPLDVEALVIAAAITAALIPLAFVVFKQLDATVADVV
ncbi:MAG TPA: ABC transporter permease [Vicinamibacterales bacterium]|nr:ABC transporter permease [Vicinamibacterales bacterium]